MEGTFKYKLKGRLKDIQNGVIEVSGFDIHIDEEKIPSDITNGMYVQFVAKIGAKLDIDTYVN